MAVDEVVYVMGSLRNVNIPILANTLRKDCGMEVFDDWFAVGPEADDYWRQYEEARGNDYAAAMQGRAAKQVFEFDKSNLDRSSHVVLVLPAGRSAHMEFGYAIGQGKKGYILLDPNADRWDVMYQFATGIARDEKELLNLIRGGNDKI